MPVQLEYIDPTDAQRYAQMAATMAFDRARERSSAETTLFPPPKSPKRRDSNSRECLHRQQSVRFVGPCSVQRRNAMSSSDGERVADVALRVAGNQLDALAAGEEYYTPEDDIASAPSSYRRLRRSRSMASTAVKPTRCSADCGYIPASMSARLTALTILRNNKENQEPSMPPRPSLRAPKSMSFLRGCRERTGSLASRENSNIAAEFRGNKFLAGLQHQEPCHNLISQPSLFSRSKKKLTETGMRKSLRSTGSHSALPSAISSPVVPPGKDDSLRAKARKVSKSVKTKLKSIFNLGKADEESPGLPNQHVESQKTHVTLGVGHTFSSRSAHSESDYADGGGSLGRVQSQLPYMHDVSSAQKLQSMQGSVESLPVGKGVSNEMSRVTSWASSGQDTLTSQQQQWAEWEKQRLSVIKENGTHAPSPSLGRLTLGGQIASPTTFVNRPQCGQPILPGPTVDSQRVYSALMKKLNETKQLADIVKQQRKASGEQTAVPGSHPQAEKNPQDREKSMPRTIRCVGVDAERLRTVRGQSLAAAAAATKDDSTDQVRIRTTSSSSAMMASYQPYPQPEPGDGKGLSPLAQLVPAGEETPIVPRTLSNRSSAFFGSPDRHLFRTTSPYRRALQASMKGADRPAKPPETGESGGISSSETSQLCQKNVNTSDDGDNVAYSESVYSCATVERTKPMREIQSVVDEFPEPPSVQGSASMFVDPPTYRPTSQRVASTVSSIDWKTWLAANVAKLEPSSSPTRTESEHLSEVEFVLPTMPKSFGHGDRNMNGHGRGHVRESAQIDTEEDPPVPQTRRPTLPTTPLSAVEPNVIKVSPMQRSVKRYTPPSGTTHNENENPRLLAAEHNKHQDQDGIRFHPVSAPPIPPKSVLRTVPPLAAVQSVRDLKAASARDMDPQTPCSEQKTSANAAAARRSRSLARIRSLNRLRTSTAGSPRFVGSTAPSASLGMLSTHLGWDCLGDPAAAASVASSSPGLSAAVERQFGGAARMERKENEGPQDTSANLNDPYGTRGAGLLGPDTGSGQVAGSKRMVDLFLSSRRRRMVSSEEGAFI